MNSSDMASSSTTIAPSIRLGYVGLNWAKKLTTSHTCRLNTFSKQKQIEVVKANLDALRQILEYNVEHGITAFRIGSQFVPFASHEKCAQMRKETQWHWREHFASELRTLGDYAKKHNIRISMHPDHFCVLNAKDDKIVQKSVAELEYHADLLDAMFGENDTIAKFQIHTGGVYGDKQLSKKRFVENYKKLSQRVRNRLVLENDDHIFSVEDVLEIHQETGKELPILFDVFHHECYNTNSLTQRDAFKQVLQTWNCIPGRNDGPAMIDYSSQQPQERRGKHRTKIDLKHFEEVICKNFAFVPDEKAETGGSDDRFVKFDIMLEIHDKETSAELAMPLLNQTLQFRRQCTAGLAQVPSFPNTVPVWSNEQDGVEVIPKRQKKGKQTATRKRSKKQKEEEEEEDENEDETSSSDGEDEAASRSQQAATTAPKTRKRVKL